MLAVNPQQMPQDWQSVIADLALSRIAVDGGATLSEIRRDLGPLTGHRLSPSEFRQHLTDALERLEQLQAITIVRGRATATSLGLETAQTKLGWRALPANWQEVRDTYLTAVSLGLENSAQTRIRQLRRPDGLRSGILQVHYGLRLRRVPTAARVRAELAGVALKNAFGNQLPDEMRLKGRVDARTSRMLASQLARRPRDFGSDARLIAALAAEILGSPQTDVGSLRLAVLRAYVSKLTQTASSEPAPTQTVLPKPEAPAAADKQPDILAFSAAVLETAEHCGSGAPGRKKAFICDVWESLRDEFPDWTISEIEFKAMLTEAHCRGHVMLANADLRPKAQAQKFQRSAINFKNTVWHYVRTKSTDEQRNTQPAAALRIPKT